MKNLKHTLAIAISACLMTTTIQANELEQRIDALYQEIALLKEAVAKQNQQQAIQQEKVQALAVTVVEKPTAEKKIVVNPTSKNGAEVTLYGYIRADAAYQFEGGTAMFNRINNIPLDGSENKKSTENRLDSTLTSSRIGLDFKTAVAEKDINGKIEVDFRGGDKNDTIRIRHAYFAFDEWLVGQTTSSFLSTETLPELVDFNGNLGGGVFRTPMLRYGNALNDQTKYLIGLEKTNDANEFPALAAKLTHQFADGKGFVNGRVMAQEVRHRSTGKDLTEMGWGAGLSVQYKPVPNLTLNGNYSHVLGDDKYFLYNANNAYIENQDVELVEFDALSLGATYRFTPKLRSTLGYGALFYDKNLANGNEDLQQTWINLMYSPFKPVTFGMEYIYGERHTMDQQQGKDNRLEIMAKYDF